MGYGLLAVARHVILSEAKDLLRVWYGSQVDPSSRRSSG